MSTHRSFGSVWNGERRVDPAVGVHHLLWYFFHDAVNGVTDILSAGDDQWEGDQDNHCCLVMKSE
jgi:hypothetical protein